MHDPIRDARPPKLAVLKTLGEQANAGTIPPKDLDPIGAFCSKDVDRPAERLCGTPHNHIYVAGDVM